MEGVSKIPDSEITRPSVYFNRRSFMRAGIVAASATASGSAYRWFNPARVAVATTAPLSGLQPTTESEDELLARGWRVNEDRTPESSILNYFNRLQRKVLRE